MKLKYYPIVILWFTVATSLFDNGWFRSFTSTVATLFLLLFVAKLAKLGVFQKG